MKQRELFVIKSENIEIFNNEFLFLFDKAQN